MIHRIELTNYRQYANKEVDFTSKLNVIQGRNGTGKSTLVEAIGYALQGSAMQKGQAKDWIKHGESIGQVVLYIDDFIITRGNKIQKVEDLQGNVLATGQTGLNSWIETTYGLTLDSYKTSYHIAQKEISNFSALSPMERTKRVEKLLRIDIIDQIKQVAQASLRLRKTQFVELNNKFINLEPLDLPKLEQTIVDLAKLADEYDNLEKLQLEQAREKAIWESNSKAFDTRVALEKLTEGFDVVSLEADLEKFNTLKAKQDVLENILAKNKAYLKLVEKLSSINIREEYFNDDLESLMDLKKAYLLSLKNRKELESFDFTLKKPALSSDKLNELIISTKSQIKALSTTGGNCPTCGQKMPDNSKIIKKLTDNLEGYRSSLIVAKAYELKDTLLDDDSKLDDIQVKIDSIMFKADYQKMLSLKEEVENFGELEADTTDYNSLITKTKKTLENFIKLEDYKDVVDPGVFIEEDYQAKLRKLKIDRQTFEKFIKEQESIKLLHETYGAELKELEVKTKKLSEFVTFIAGYRKSFSLKVLPLIEDNATKIVSYLSEGKINSFSLTEDYSIEGYETLSGSEEDSADFALRLAIAQIARLGSYNTMILDEVAASFDSVKEGKLLDILKETNMQLIYISHGDITV